MSKRVIFVCIVLLLLGLGSGRQMLVALLSGRWTWNFGVLFIPISIGLFQGRLFARTAAVALFFLIYALLATFMVLAIFYDRTMAGANTLEVFKAQGASWLVLVFVAVIGSPIAILHWMLYTPPFEEHLS